jgi:hypothetical protein
MEKDQILRTSIHSRNDHTVSTCYSKNLASNIHVKLHADFQTPRPKKWKKLQAYLYTQALSFLKRVW